MPEKIAQIGDLVIVDLGLDPHDGLAQLLLSGYDGRIGLMIEKGDEDTNESRKDYPCVQFEDGHTCCFPRAILLRLERD